MANHVRQQIREAVAAQLAGSVTTGSRVFQSRVKVLAESELPALVVLTNQENISMENIHPDPVLNRALTLTVLAKAKATNNIDDVLDTIIKEVEIKLAGWQSVPALNSLIGGLVLNSIDVEINADNETQVAESTIEFLVNYFTQASMPDVSI